MAILEGNVGPNQYRDTVAMKHKAIIGLSIILIFGIWWWIASRQYAQPSVPRSTEISRQGKHGDSPQNAGVPESMQRIPGESPEQEWDRHVDFINVPIVFYGRVVDQDSKPLKGVLVTPEVKRSTTMAEFAGRVNDVTKCPPVETDSNGLFTIRGPRGFLLDFGLQKEGYRGVGGGATYEKTLPECHVPDPKSPIEYILISETLPMAEKVYDMRLKFKWNLGEVVVDLGPEVGRVVLDPSRSGMNPQNRRQHFDWAVAVRTEGFAVIPLYEAWHRLRLAPITGYQQYFDFKYPKGTEKWASRISRNFAIRTSDGKFGLCRLAISGNGNDGGMCGAIEVYLNRSGFRNIDHK